MIYESVHASSLLNDETLRRGVVPGTVNASRPSICLGHSDRLVVGTKQIGASRHGDQHAEESRVGRGGTVVARDIGLHAAYEGGAVFDGAGAEWEVDMGEGVRDSTVDDDDEGNRE